MNNKIQVLVLGVVAILFVAGLVYTFNTPWNRIAGIHIGGTLTPPPADFNSINVAGLANLKTGGFPPFVVNIVYSTDTDGIITATRPDNGYWGRRARIEPNGWIRVGDATYALQATEIFGDERIPYLESYAANNAMNMGYDFEGEIIPGVNEPVHTWEVFYWTPRQATSH